jgi:hypothetical protein
MVSVDKTTEKSAQNFQQKNYTKKSASMSLYYISEAMCEELIHCDVG